MNVLIKLNSVFTGTVEEACGGSVSNFESKHSSD